MAVSDLARRGVDLGRVVKRTALLALVLGLILLAAPASAADVVPITGTYGSSSEWCGTYTPSDPSPRTFVVGDSLTVDGRPYLLALHPSWEIQGLRGRNVDCLPMMVSERLKHGPLDRLVIALGTNAVPGWGEADYQAVVDMVPASTSVVFVNTYRDPSLWPNTEAQPYRTRAGVQWHYSRDLADVVASRPATCLVNWRGYAQAHPGLLLDGTHPRPRARAAWARMVSRAAAGCGLQRWLYAR